MSPKVSRELVNHSYDDEFVAKPEATEAQIQTAEDLLKLVENYLKQK